MKLSIIKKTKRPIIKEAKNFEPDAFVIRTCAADGGSHGDFKWPLAIDEVVVCPDWNPAPQCGNGFHGLLDGIGDWCLLDCSAGRIWQVIGVRRAETVAIDADKVKFPRGKIAYCGAAAGAMAFIQPHMIDAILREARGNTATGDGSHAAATGPSSHAAATGPRGHAVATGYDGHALATGHRGYAAAIGDSGHAVATGYEGHAAATGYIGHAAATGPRGHAVATGDIGHAAATGPSGYAAAAGNSGHAAATGDGGHAAATGTNAIAVSLGVNGTAEATTGWIVLAGYDEQLNLISVRTAKVGSPEGIKPGTPYRLNSSGEFEEVTQ